MKIINLPFWLFLILFPLLFLPLNNGDYDFFKLAFFLTFASLLFFICLISIVRRKGFNYSLTGILLLIITAIMLLSAILQSTNLVIVLTTPLSVSTVFAGTLLYFVLINNKIIGNKAIKIFLLIYTILAFIVFSYPFFLGSKPLLLPFSYGFKIAGEVMKDPKSLLIGIGPTNFMTAFTLGKSASINSTPFWNVIFTSSSSFFLNLVTETGIITGLIYLFIFFKSLRSLKSPKLLNVSLFLLLLFQLVFPSTMPIFMMTIILLALTGSRETKEVKLGNSVYIFTFPLVIFILISLFFTGSWTLAEINYRQSVSALSANRGTDAYNFQKNAISYNPRLDRYHLALSQTSLALANALSTKKELTPDDQQNIPKLIQQSIEEARLAVELNKTSIINWDNLAKIYSSLVNFAAGSDKWAIDADEQKIRLDPQNPNHRIALGNLLFNLKRYDEAQIQYSEAVSLKSDLPIARYQLAQTLKEQKKYAQSRKELQETLSLLEVNSPDAQKVQKELEELPYP